MFPDGTFTFACSVARHLPGLGSEPAPTKGKQEILLEGMIENTRANINLTISVDAASDLLHDEQPFLLDVREAGPYGSSHVPEAVNIPLHDLSDRRSELPADKDAPVLTICERGNISLPAVLFLTSLGYTDVRSIDGGTQAWRGQGLATTRSL